MRIAIISGGTGWHVQDLLRAAGELGHRAEAVDFRSLAAGVEAAPAPLAGFDAAIIRTVPAGSLEQVVFRMDLLAPSPRTASDRQCPHGVQFYDVADERARSERAAWSYEAPGAAMKKVDHWIGFWEDVDVEP